jgi:hypothetical protein
MSNSCCGKKLTDLRLTHRLIPPSVPLLSNVLVSASSANKPLAKGVTGARTLDRNASAASLGDHRAIGVGKGIRALAQNAFRGDPLQSQCRLEERVLAKAGNRLKVALAETQQADVAGQHVPMRHRVAAHRRNRRRILCQISMALQRLTNASESSLGGEIRLRFRNDETAQRATCQVSWATDASYRYPVVSERVCQTDGLLKVTDLGEYP